MPWEIKDGYVVKKGTGERVNKKRLPAARLKKLLRALYANYKKGKK